MSKGRPPNDTIWEVVFFYLYAPDGVGRSKLAAGVEKLLGVAMTDRNWKTIRKLWEMIKNG